MKMSTPENLLAKGSDEYKRFSNQIADMNMDIQIFLEKFKEFRKSTNFIDKNLCTGLNDILDNIDQFLDSNTVDLDSHKKTKIFINFKRESVKQLFICECCDEVAGFNWQEVKNHVVLPMHRKRVEKKSTNDSTSVNHIIKPTATKQAHDNIKETRKQKKERKEDKMNLPKKIKAFINGNVDGFLTEAVKEGNKMKCIPAYDNISQMLLDVVKPVYPDAKVHFFGSRPNGLGTKHSDLDLFLDIDNAFNKYMESPEDILKKLANVRKILTKNKDVWQNVQAVTSARVPILKVFNANNRIDCDICFSNGLGSCNTQLMLYFFELQPICHKMCLFIKKWLNLSNLGHQFSTYTLVLMVVFFLQKKEILPSVAELQLGLLPVATIGPWQYNFTKKTLKQLNKLKARDDILDCEKLLYEFFIYYSRFDFGTFVVCPFLGEFVQKTAFNKSEELFPRYMQYYKANPNNGFHIDKCMCVQDPFEQNHNVAKGISSGLLKLLKDYFKLSAQELTAKKRIF